MPAGWTVEHLKNYIFCVALEQVEDICFLSLQKLSTNNFTEAEDVAMTPVNIYLLRVTDIVMVFLLLTLNIFSTFF